MSDKGKEREEKERRKEGGWEGANLIKQRLQSHMENVGGMLPDSECLGKAPPMVPTCHTIPRGI